MDLQIVDYKQEYQPYFEKFNKAWLEEFFTVEPLDKWVLEQPDEAIISKDGKIYFAAAGADIIGTASSRVIDEDVY